VVNQISTSFRETCLAVFDSLMSTNSSQHVAVPLPRPSQSTIGMALARMALVHCPAFVWNSTAPLVLYPSWVGAP
jgi:hypothetical protein